MVSFGIKYANKWLLALVYLLSVQEVIMLYRKASSTWGQTNIAAIIYSEV